MTRPTKIKTIEIIALLTLWVVMFAAPVLIGNSFERNWRAIHILWVEFSVIGVAFLWNRYLFMPKLFFTKRYFAYLSAFISLLTLIAIFVYYYDGIHVILSLFTENPAQPLQRGGKALIPHNVVSPEQRFMILLTVVLALDNGLNISIKWLSSEQKRNQLYNENISSKLANLQNQISPHFFMNTLNNIHALVDIDPQRAQQTIIELSGLMDYLLYDSPNCQVAPVQKEIDFTRSYINLMKLRYPKRVKINFGYNEPIPNDKIPPLLFLNFIENAFKYGVNYSKDSYIDISFNFSHDHIEFNVRNSNHASSVKQRGRNGLGIINTCKRLDILYGTAYKLDMTTTELEYNINLKIPLYKNDKLYCN